MSPQPFTYQWRGQLYVGQKAVAEAAGVCEQTVCCHLAKHGNLDRLGVGRGNHSSHHVPEGKPISVLGIEFPSATAFARMVGVSPKAMQKRIRHGRWHLINASLREWQAGEAARADEALQKAWAASIKIEEKAKPEREVEEYNHPRQDDVIDMVERGISRRAIAASLRISTKTVWRIMQQRIAA